MSGAILVESCKNNHLPNIATMTSFGLDGCGGTNPVAIFGCYRAAVNVDGVTAKQLDYHRERGTLNQFILETLPKVKDCEYYEQVLAKGGIKVSGCEGQSECGYCNFCSVHDNNICSNCLKNVSDTIRK